LATVLRIGKTCDMALAPTIRRRNYARSAARDKTLARGLRGRGKASFAKKEGDPRGCEPPRVP
jgi:hypothetical protein